MDCAGTSRAPERFAPRLRAYAYRDESEYLADRFALLGLALESAIELRRQVSQSQSPVAVPPGIDLGVAEATRQVVAFPCKNGMDYSGLGSMLRALEAHIDDRTDHTLEQGGFLRLEWLTLQLDLDRFTVLALLCAFAAATDRAFESLFVALHGEPTLRFATLGTVQALFSLQTPFLPGDMAAMCDPVSAANRLLFCESDPSIPDLLRPIQLRPAILRYLQGLPHHSPNWWSHARTLPGSETLPPLLRRDSQLLFLGNALPKAQLGVRQLLLLCGQPGSGRKLTLETLARRERQPMIVLRLVPSLLRAKDSLPELARDLATLLVLNLQLPVLELDEEPDEQALTLLEALAAHGAPVILLVPHLRSSLMLPLYLIRRLDFPEPSLEEAMLFWEHFGSQVPNLPALEWNELAAKHVLTPGQIRGALSQATADASAEGVAVTLRHLDRAVIQGNASRLSAVADQISVYYNWEDLVLGEETEQLLRHVCDRVKIRSVVEAQWGFGRKNTYGKGISVLLYGPPGTGKTMSAQVIAGELGRPLYRINLAQVISKYIGETAKNLDAVFREAKHSNVILFFDEADALFTKRTEVKNSNDRHANSESAYLLQKIEEYDGISILATNLSSNFDEAFRRRIHYMINIHMPSVAQRLELWRGAFPENAPLARSVDFPVLAENLEFSGSVIKSAALQAACFAAIGQHEIGMPDIVRAVRLELKKLGKSEPHFMGAYPAEEQG